MKKPDNLPLAKRRGRLKNGNPSGDYSLSPRCGAYARRTKMPCNGPAMTNGRCRMHGGKSTGPKTICGIVNSRKANWKHGEYSVESRKQRKECSELIKMAQKVLGWK